ncbi:MAG: GNAT family N-acetyltransferase [Casimicrobiaceae bacterium]
MSRSGRQPASLPLDYQLRLAVAADQPALEGLIARAAHALSVGDYSTAQIDGALQGSFGVDSQLVRDGTYFVVEAAGEIVACGGWSRRHTLFGGDARANRSAALLDPKCDSARIRAFFVAPEHARRGVGTLLLRHCEAVARAEGFTSLALVATLPGMRLYARHGFLQTGTLEHCLAEGLTITFVPMSKSLAESDPPPDSAQEVGRDA